MEKLIWKIYNLKAGYYKNYPALYQKLIFWRDDIFAEMRLAFLLTNGDIKAVGRAFDSFLKKMGYSKKINKFDFQLKKSQDNNHEELLNFVNLIIAVYQQYDITKVYEVLKLYKIHNFNKNKIKKLLARYFPKSKSLKNKEIQQ